MIEILVPSSYRGLKGKSERLVFICLWAWLSLSWRKMFYDMARKFNFKYLGKREFKIYTGEVVRVETWWDEKARKLEPLVVLNPASYPQVEHAYERWVSKGDHRKIMYWEAHPSGVLKEKDFLKTFGLKRTTFIMALKKLERKGLIATQIYMPEKTRRLGRVWEFKQPLRDIVQIPLHILKRHDLTTAERLIGIEFYRLKQEKRRVKTKDLVKETGFSKVTVSNARQKL